MKRFDKKNSMKTTSAFLALFLTSVWHAPNARCASEPTEGTVTFQFTTVTTAQQFAPRNVMAVWVADRRGSLVTTLRVNGGRYSRYPTQWSLTAGRNRVDAVSGATMRFHDTHTVVWDCRNAGRNAVSDGAYQIRVEFTEKNGTGPVDKGSLSAHTVHVQPHGARAAGFTRLGNNREPNRAPLLGILHRSAAFLNRGIWRFLRKQFETLGEAL